MSMGQSDDPRRFRRPYTYDVTKDIAKEKTKWDKCEVCGEDITGQAYRIEEGKYVCFRCYNEPL